MLRGYVSPSLSELYNTAMHYFLKFHAVTVWYILYVLTYTPTPMAHSYRLGLVTCVYQVWIPVGTDICHRGCAYTVLQTVQRNGVYSAAYGTVHYKEPLKSCEIRVGHSPSFGLLSVAILPWLCSKRSKAIFIYIHIKIYISHSHCVLYNITMCYRDMVAVWRSWH